MKKFFTLVFCVALSSWSFGQQTLSNVGKLQEPTQKMSDEESAAYNPATEGSTYAVGTPDAAGAVIWSEDFGGGFPAGWTLLDTSGMCPWKHTFNGSSGFFWGNRSPIASTTANNGFLICDPDSANDAAFGQPSGQTYQYLSTYFVTDGISTMGSPNVRLEFEQYFRYNNSITLNVQVSNVGPNGPFQDQYTVQGNVAANQDGQNAETVSILLSASMGNQANIWVKVGWSARVYFWMLDDMRIVEAPDNDLSITQQYYGPLGDSTLTEWYHSIPERQAEVTDLGFSAAITNLGTGTVTNTALEVNVNSGSSSIYNQTSPTNGVGPFATDSFAVATPYSMNSNLGDYDIDFIAVSDSTDIYPSDDTVSHTVEVTNSIYARENGQNSGGISWAAGTDVFALTQMFTFEQPDTIVGIEIQFFNNATSGNGTTVGGVLNVHVWDTGFNKLPGGTEFHVIDTSETPLNGIGRIIFNEAVPVPAGEFMIGFEMVSQGEQVWIATRDFNIDDAPPLTAFVDVGVDGTWGYIADIPIMRAVTKPKLCESVTISSTGTTSGDPNLGTGAITLSNPTGGSGLYTYSWSGPSGFTGSSNMNLTGLNIAGVYSVTITDGDYCSNVITVDLPVGIDESLNTLSNIKVSPNPNNGIFQLNFVNALQDVYTIQVTNLVGQEVYRSSEGMSGTAQKQINLSHLEKGIYLVNVTNSDELGVTHRVVVQ